jgi:hypothetical protein
VGIENGGVLLAEFTPYRITVFFDFSGRFSNSIGKPLQFSIYGASGHEAPWNPKSLAVENECLADCYSRRDCNTL